MEIRKYRLEDEKEIISLWIRCDLVKPWNNPQKDIERKLKIDPDLFLVGIVENKIIAAVMGGYEGHRGWINYLAVDPSYQRKGYATKIVKVIEKKIEDKGAPKINLQIRTSNISVIEFYKSMNYRIDDVISMGIRLVEDTGYKNNEIENKIEK
jgi:ribosomal protein S18 acetylase RimI-like enzyme